MKCAWAACTRNAYRFVTGHPMCAAHEAEHYIQLDDERRENANARNTGRVDDSTLRYAHRSGLNDAEIGELLGVSRQTVRVHRKRLGLPINDHKRAAELSPIDHGTQAGAQQHRRRNQKPCRVCVEAENRARVDRERRRSA